MKNVYLSTLKGDYCSGTAIIYAESSEEASDLLINRQKAENDFGIYSVEDAEYKVAEDGWKVHGNHLWHTSGTWSRPKLLQDAQSSALASLVAYFEYNEV